ncbi:tRNA lysidine(34) synthetase TilS [Paenibacillus agricola]|uniref:tRNA(Ile)-lysidine synthase n=1 Tax=Paenibacillus agricola TaxID=2716264 RepID=A0ABX0JGL1_9BACL|nr:tRNA lysidine(34) synthetase TilS [Paenibacillus agricola]NHN35063.1 tRNA lysidine(34) synthetase TilS [Paenibacillus agricola]
MDLLTKVEQTIKSEKLLEEGECIVVAVSGGPDSVALLHLLFALAERWHWRLVVAHLNHGFRGEESEEEALFVAGIAAQLGVTFEEAHLDVPAYIRATGTNPQVAARELRYGFLREIAHKHKAAAIVLAHHADDQAETLLMRLLRGTGPAGLVGIPVRRFEKDVELVRPLLRIYKSELLDYCHAHHFAFRMDSSNLDTKYFRNEVRLDLLPRLRQYNDQLPQSLNRLSVMMAAEQDFMDMQTRAIFKEGVLQESDFCEWSKKWFCGLHVALQRRLIKLILNCLDCEADSIDFMKLEQIRDAILGETSSNLSLHIGGNLVLAREYDRIYLHNDVVPPKPYAYTLEQDMRVLAIEETGITVESIWLERAPQQEQWAPPVHGQNAAWFDAEQLLFPLQVRSRQDGDRMRLLGMDGSKKVKDIFIDSKIPPSIRLKTPIVMDSQEQVIWLPGVRRSSHALVTAQTRFVFCLSIYN